jgi:glyoxylase-like metal-dependent hydrolase (beta-lactamase superfamily II)
VLIERSMHPGWLSNAYLVADEPAGTAVFVDSGAPLEPLLAVVEREGLTPTHLLVTHGHGDHVAGNAELERRFALEVTQDALETGGLRVRALPTPGHSPDGVSFVVDELVCFSGDTLFRDAVGGTRDDFEGVRHSVMDVLMQLPPETRVLPGHTDETTIGREWEENPFVRVWRGLDPEGTEPCRVGGEEATLVVWSPDYDGKGKAWVRFRDGRDAIVGGSRIERGILS